MTNFVQLHVLTHYPVSNPNRDDLGMSKTVVVNGRTRLRLSSQSVKHAIRTSATFVAALKKGEETCGTRTTRVGQMVIDHLNKREKKIDPDRVHAISEQLTRALDPFIEKKNSAKGSKKSDEAAPSEDEDEAVAGETEDEDEPEQPAPDSEKPGRGRPRTMAMAVRAESKRGGKAGGKGLPTATPEPKPVADAAAAKKEVARTEQLVFLSPVEIVNLFALADDLANGRTEPVTVKDILRPVATTATAIDVAMNGRMMTKFHAFDVHAAAHFSHSISTHEATVQEDYFSARDDYQPAEELDRTAGAAHIGSRGFNGGGLYYTHVVINRDLLLANLGGNEVLAAIAIKALVKALMTEAPRGMVSSFAQYPAAEFVLVERGSAQPFDESVAFQPAIRDDDVVTASIARLRQKRKLKNTRFEITVDKLEFSPDKPEVTISMIAEFASAPFASAA